MTGESVLRSLLGRNHLYQCQRCGLVTNLTWKLLCMDCDTRMAATTEEVERAHKLWEDYHPKVKP